MIHRTRRFPIAVAATAALLLASALPALAAEVVTIDGVSHTCEVLRVDPDGVLVRGKMKSGDVVEVKIPASKVDPQCWYGLRDAAIGNDAKARVDFAVWCVEHDLYSHAKSQMKKAAAADPKLLEDLTAGKYPEIREGIAKRVLASAEADMSHGRLDAARQKLEMLLLRLSDTASGGRACDVIKVLDEKTAAAERQSAADAAAKLDAEAKKAADARAKLFEPADADYEKAKQLATEGLTEDSDQKALDHLAQALTRGAASMSKLDALEKAHAADADVVAGVAERRTKTVAGMVKLHVHRADLYIWRGSLPNAKKELDAASKLDPSNPDIASAMQRLLAADEDDPLELRWLRERRETGSRFGRGGRGR